MIAALAEQGGIRLLIRSRLVKSSRQASTCGLAPSPIACARVFCPARDHRRQRIAELKLHEFALSDGAVLETNCVYIVPLLESLRCRRISPRPPTQKAPRAGSMFSPESLLTRHAASIALQAATTGRFTPRSARRLFPFWCARARAVANAPAPGNAVLSADALRAVHARERLVDRAEA